MPPSSLCLLYARHARRSRPVCAGLLEQTRVEVDHLSYLERGRIFQPIPKASCRARPRAGHAERDRHLDRLLPRHLLIHHLRQLLLKPVTLWGVPAPRLGGGGAAAGWMRPSGGGDPTARVGALVAGGSACIRDRGAPGSREQAEGLR